MKLYPLLLCSCALTSLILGLVIVDSIVATSCIYYMKQFNWGCNSTGNNAKLYTCRCGNEVWLESISNCIFQESSNVGQRDHALLHASKRCYKKSKQEIKISLKDFYIYHKNTSSLLRLANNSKDTVDLVTVPLKLNETDFQFYRNSFKNVRDQVNKTQWFGWALNFYWIFIMMISVIWSNRHSVLFLLSEKQVNNMKSILIQASLSALKNYNSPYYFADIFPMMIPTRIEFLAITCFWILVIIFSIVDYHMMIPNAYMGDSKFYYLLDFISYRTCIMSISLLPSMYLMGIRNNPLNNFVQWSRKTFITFHKTIALAMTLLAFIHSCVWTAYTIKEGDYSTWAIDAYWKWGISSMVSISLILLFSIKWLRMVLYDVFLFLHHFFSIAFIVSIYYHIYTLGWLSWCYSIIAIYSWDKLIRLVKIFFSGKLIKRAEVEYFDSSLIKLSIPAKKVALQHQPGDYTFLYFLKPNFFARGWQSHPFSVYPDPNDSNKLCCIIKVKRGITKSVYHHLLRESMKKEKRLNIPIIMEGKYGLKPILADLKIDSSRDYVFVAAGLGISSIYPYLLKLLKNISENDYQKIRLFWIVHNIDVLSWFKKEIRHLTEYFGLTNEKQQFKIEIIITNKSKYYLPHCHNEKHNDLPISSSSDCCLQSSDALSSDDSDHYNINMSEFGLVENSSFKISCLPVATRPCLRKLIKMNQIRRSTYFICCGPSVFSDNIRSAVNQYRLESHSDHEINYYEECFEL
ncbi:uncharacterized protein PRCAT00001404001 [Priceomyces carsonii]|uniref:uncharacterized protein n=1 Tax=Priceomyces carsonii TaxID=28549 RepID=UPI002ED937C6|nr:unnamed protein product [Priceomyces carsonii]